jgi:hypothetical protein
MVQRRDTQPPVNGNLATMAPRLMLLDTKHAPGGTVEEVLHIFVDRPPDCDRPVALVLGCSKAFARKWNAHFWQDFMCLWPIRRRNVTAAVKAVAPYVLNKHCHLFAVDTIVLGEAHNITPHDVAVLDILLRENADRLRGKADVAFGGKKVVVMGDDVRRVWKERQQRQKCNHTKRMMRCFAHMDVATVLRLLVTREGKGEN